MSDESKDTLTTRKIQEPQFPVSESAGLLTVPADSVQIAVDHDAHVCTFMFFQYHPTPKGTNRGIIFDGIHKEKFMEVKMSLEAAFGVGEYMHQLLKEMRNNPNLRGFSSGPTAIEQTPQKT